MPHPSSNVRSLLVVTTACLLHCGAPSAPASRSEAPLCSDLCALAPSFARPMATATSAPAVDASTSGRPALIAFLSPIAPPSYGHAQAMSELATALGTQKGAAIFLVITTDGGSEKSPAPSDALTTTVSASLRARVIRDPGERLADAFGTKRFPETWLVDGKGRIRARWDGERHLDPALVGRVLDGIAAGADCSVSIDPAGEYTETPPTVTGLDADACKRAWRPSPR